MTGGGKDVLYFRPKLTLAPNMKKNKLLVTGAIIFILSVIVGLLGTALSIASSFTALNGPESAGIERVGNGIASAMLFTTASLIGSTVGLVLLAAGAIASYRRSKKPQPYTE